MTGYDPRSVKEGDNCGIRIAGCEENVFVGTHISVQTYSHLFETGSSSPAVRSLWDRIANPNVAAPFRITSFSHQGYRSHRPSSNNGLCKRSVCEKLFASFIDFKVSTAS